MYRESRTRCKDIEPDNSVARKRRSGASNSRGGEPQRAMVYAQGRKPLSPQILDQSQQRHRLWPQVHQYCVENWN